ncbi:MAG: hypothetical protein HY697_04475 [Deltaproteobacteria bacterium]|nr:hypothetical protein [Deltaproteobacteria bacterium]
MILSRQGMSSLTHFVLIFLIAIFFAIPIYLLFFTAPFQIWQKCLAPAALNLTGILIR